MYLKMLHIVQSVVKLDLDLSLFCLLRYTCLWIFWTNYCLPKVFGQTDQSRQCIVSKSITKCGIYSGSVLFAFHPADFRCINPCHAEWIKMPHPLLLVSQLDSLTQIVDINSHTEWQTVQIQISWLLQKPTDLVVHCLQRQGISGFSRTRVGSQMDLFKF